MNMTRQTILASRPAAMVLALTLVAGLSAPFVMLPRAKAAPTPLACTENNHNGCTELSPTPPQDTVAVPPNIVLMLDDSGSMNWDVMPDYGFLSDTSEEGLISSDVNGVYYSPGSTYTPPPHADGTSYPQADFAAAPVDGLDTGSSTVALNTYRGMYDSYNTNYVGTPVEYSISVPIVGASTYSPASSCPSGTSLSGGAQPGYCAFNDQSDPPSVPFNFFSTNGYFYVSRCKNISDVFTYNSTKSKQYCTPGISFFTYTTQNTGGGYTRYYVAANTGDCAKVGLSSSVCDESAATRQNVANWFAYYHTRILMAKSGLMRSFATLNPKYRFGFGSINGSAASWISSNASAVYDFSTSTKSSNKLAEVQPFGDGTTGTQKAKFWDWILNTNPSNSTPLRGALRAVGEYYSTSQPWSTMAGDPGYTSTGTNPTYACRASYTILTTDGFWNGGNVTTPTGIVGAASTDGPTYSPPAGTTYTTTQYLAVGPFSGGGAQSSGKTVASLADVATYYWSHDLQSSLANEVAVSPADPAFWQHMTTFTMGLGFTPKGISPTSATQDQIFAWALDGGGTGSTSAITGFSWPTPSPDSQGSVNNIADLEHAAVNGHGNFFSATSPDKLIQGFSRAFAEIGTRGGSSIGAVNASVITTGAVSFEVGYNPKDWSGTFSAIILNADGSGQSTPIWKAETQLTTDFHSASGAATRKVYSASYTTAKAFNAGFQFNVANKNSLDAVESAALMLPAPTNTTTDTLANRISYLLGDPTNEGTVYRTRSSLLGSIIRSQPVYVSYAASGYYSRWPNLADGTVAPEAATGAQTYDAFVAQESTRPGTVYVGANDGMLHAFNAPVPTCTAYASGVCTTYAPGTGAGKERWAFIPRAVYANLGNLTVPGFSYRPTVDETPVTRDVFFSDQKWHTLLAGGVGLGGRGVYALDITDPTTFSASSVLWEFDSDMAVASTCFASYGTCKASDLGYTISKPNIGRLHNGKWAVLVSNGYFPDCSTPDIPTDTNTNCQAIAAQAPKDSTGNPYSALFVLDAQTGAMIAELKTPTNITGVTSFGLATPVLGDYDNNQVDDVAFAGDAQGNLWRFDLSNSDPTKWTVTLAYKGLANAASVQGQQPITSMPRLFPDPSSNRFIVLFGTGKFLGIGDNSDNTVQSLYAVRDQGNSATSAMAYSQTDLVQQYLHETVVPTTVPDGAGGTKPNPDPNAGASLRCVTGKPGDTCDSATAAQVNPSTAAGGWFINLQTTASDGTVNDAGERVVVNPGAIFASNTVVFETLITGSASSDPCSPSTEGSVMALNAVTGGASGASSLGGWPIVGARVDNARTSGSLPVVSALGGGQVYLPGLSVLPNKPPISFDAPIWRRRSWQEIQQ